MHLIKNKTNLCLDSMITVWLLMFDVGAVG